jgi:7,8-dihydropterin-6-yl-methyl-4-(beta-D-ribofuranosyl)aminobenzene 5'-phosphate synthase
MRITVLCENTIGVPVPMGLMAEHGLSFWIEDSGVTLYDTGQGVGIINNIGLLGKDVNAVDRIILSHGHYDHTGGLMPVLTKRDAGVPVYLHAEAFRSKVASIQMPEGEVGFPIGFQYSREEYAQNGAEFKFVDHFTRIDDKIFTISDIDRPKGWKTWDARLKISENGQIMDDPFNDDLSVLLETGSGPVVLLGCAHAGIVEILDDLSAKTGHQEFHAVIGGTHLGTAPEAYIDRAIESFRKYKLKVIGTSHCTGFTASARIMAQFKKEFVPANVGSVFDF